MKSLTNWSTIATEGWTMKIRANASRGSGVRMPRTLGIARFD
jgi:hypothetical protein